MKSHTPQRCGISLLDRVDRVLSVSPAAAPAKK
jgi:hypothetical protein